MQEGADLCGCGLAAALLVSFSLGEPLNSGWECDFCASEALGSIPVQSHTSEHSADVTVSPSWFHVNPFLLGCPSAQGGHCIPCNAPQPCWSWDVQASSEMCCLFFQIFHKTFSYFSGESKTSLDWKGLLQIICFHPPGLPVCAPAVSVGSKRDPAPFLVPRIHPPSAFWCDPATSLCLLVQWGQ